MSLHIPMDENQLSAILALTKEPIALYITDQFVIRAANNAMLSLWDKDESVFNMALKQAIPDLEDKYLLDMLRDVWQSGADHKRKAVPVRMNNAERDEWRYFDMDFKVLKDESNSITSILHIAVESNNVETYDQTLSEYNKPSSEAFFRATSLAINNSDTVQADDVSLIKKYRAAKQDAEHERDRVKQFFMQAPAGICVLKGEDMVFELINPQYQQFFPGRELLGKPVLTALPELKNSPINEILKSVYETGKTYEGKELHVPLAYTSDGPIADRYFNFIYQARLNPQGGIDGILVFVVEVTDTVLNRKKIEEKESDLRSMVMSSHYGLMILKGKDFKIEIANQQIATLWHKTLPEILGKVLLDVLPEITNQPFPALLKQVMDTGIAYSQEEESLYIDSPTGQIRKFVSFYYDPMFDAAGTVTGIIVACEDITEKVKSRQLLHDSYEEQQSLNEELSAANEELANINEEMASTNEELISTNDELVETQAILQHMINELEESKTKIAAIVASAPFPIGVYEGREMRIALANKTIMEVWGKGFDVVGKLYSEILPELENQEIFGQLDNVFTTGIPFHAKNQRVDLVIEGKLKAFYFNYSFTPLFDRNDNIYGVMNTAADVTDLTVAKLTIERNEQNLNNLILQSPVAMCFLSGPEHFITVANPLMLEIWGKPMADVMYKPVFEALPDAREQGLENVMADVYYKGQTFRADEMPVNLIRNGQPDTVYQNFVYEPFRDADGNIVGIIAITIDVTEQVLTRKKIEHNEAELLKVKQQLEAELEAGKEIQRQKDSFIGIASHELKTPLTSLTAIIQVANKKLKVNNDPFLSGAMEKAQIQIKRMSSLISGFLNISRFESGNMVINKEKFDLHNLVQEVVEEVNLTSTTHTVHFESEGSVVIEADRDKINSVITNLLNNAIKYSPKESEVSINCNIDAQSAKVVVTDSGIGINKEDQHRVFDRYFRVEADHTQHISGFGIGLYLSAEIVRRHKGKIWVESELGQGSKFIFTLPLFNQ